MRILGSPGAFRHFLSTVLLGAVLLPASGFAVSAPGGMVALEDDEMAGVSGAGLAFALDDFRFQMAPTSYFEQIGAPAHPSTTFNTGDYRWIGTTISSGSSTNLYAFHDYVGPGGNAISPTSSSCNTALSPLGCPIAQEGARGYAEVNNPFVLRVRDYTAVGREGIHADPNAGWMPGQVNTVAELVGPTASADFRWAFWGEVEASNETGSLGVLQNQNVIIGAPVSRFRPDQPELAGPVFRMYQNMTDQSLGMIYHHRLSGDYRFSVHQSGVTSVDGWAGSGVPHFTSQEGMYFTNVNAYLPLGQLHYQSLILDAAAAQDGNFVVQLTRLPNNQHAYNDFYSSGGPTGYERTGRPDRYYETHGYVRWGDKFPGEGGVSNVRFAGPGSTSSSLVVSYDLPAITINQANFPNADPGFCTNRTFGNDCDRWNGAQAPAISRSITFTGVPTVTSPHSNQQVLQEGGIVFVSRSGGSWSVPNNPNLTGSRLGGVALGLAESDYNVKIERTNRGQSVSCGLFCTDWELRPRSGGPNVGAIDNRIRAIINSQGGVTPVLDVTAINLGSARVEGMLIQHLKITTLGAANP